MVKKMRTKTFLLSVFLIVTMLLGACGNPTSASLPSAPADSSRVVYWGDPAALADTDVQEVMSLNAASAPWRRSMNDILGQGVAVDVFIDCDDGRVCAEQQFYAKLIQDGYAVPPHLEIGILAGEVTPELLKYVQYLIDSGWIHVRSFNISTHTCADSSCGAQGVKAEIESGKPLAEFQAHGVGEAAAWIDANVTSSHPVDQLGANVAEVYNYFDGEYPVFGWIADHGTQSRELAAELHSGQPDDFAIRDELVRLNRESAEILAPLAEQQGLNLSQSFKRIVVTDYYGPVEGLLKIQEGLDEAFNVSVLVAPNFTDVDVANTIAAARAATQYALAYAGAETEVILAFQDEALMRQFLEALQPLAAYQKFLTDSTFQEVVAYKLAPDGSIRDVLLIKPAHTIVTRTVGPVFRGHTIRMVEDGWALFEGDPTTTADHAVWFRQDVNGKTLFKYTGDDLVTLERRYLGTKAYAEANGLDTTDLVFDKTDPYNPELTVPDWGEPVLELLKQAGYPQDMLDRFANDAIDRMMKAYPAVALPYDTGIKQFVSGPYGTLDVDWEDALIGEQAVRKVFPTAESYYSSLVSTFTVSWQNHAAQSGLYHMREIHWQIPAFSAWVGTGAEEYISAETLAAFEQAHRDLGSANPETVAAGRNWLRANGAFEVPGQPGIWAITGRNSVYAQAPIRFSTLRSYYVNGDVSFAGFQTKWGVIGLQRAENIPGVFGWNISAPRFSLWAQGVAEIPTVKLVSSYFTEIVAVAMEAWMLNEVRDFATQTEYMAMIPTQPTTLSAPAGATFWSPNDKTPWVSTRWTMSYEALSQGCNGTGVFGEGCGAYMPDGQRSPLYIVGGLASEHWSVRTWPSFGMDGNNVNTSWEYQRWGNSFTLWYQGVVVEPGTVMDYDEFVITDEGMWFIPHHAEFMTAACPGLCIQQATGGEQFLFVEGAEPQFIELCPDVNDASVCWRP